MEIERRTLALELRVEQRDGKPTIVGHAAVFNALSEDLGGFREKIAPGAFSETITTDDIRGLFNHDPNAVLGRNRSGTLRLVEDGHGLAFEIQPPATRTAQDVVSLIERGDISGNSFSFQTLEDGWEFKDGDDIRTLKKVRLFDVGPVTFPAYPQTDVAMRSLEGIRLSRLASALPKGAPKRDGWRRRLEILTARGSRA